MTNPNLSFNILTFDFPPEKQTFYFAKDDNAKGHNIYKTLFPKEIGSIFPGTDSNGTDFIFTTFTGKKWGSAACTGNLYASRTFPSQ